MTALITETHPPALSRVPLHLLSEDINLLVSLVKLYLSFLLRYLIFSRGPLQHILLSDSLLQHILLLDSLHAAHYETSSTSLSPKNPHLISEIGF